jgi:hypothetical protein
MIWLSLINQRNEPIEISLIGVKIGFYLIPYYAHASVVLISIITFVSNIKLR